MLSVLLMMNIFVYIGINFSLAADESSQLNPELKFYWKGDLIEKFMGKSLDNITISTRANWTDYDVKFNQSFSTFVEELGSESINQGGISFLDGLKIVLAFFKTLWNVAFSPLIFFMNFRVPVLVGLILGLPMVILYVTTIILAIRGVGD